MPISEQTQCNQPALSAMLFPNTPQKDIFYQTQKAILLEMEFQKIVTFG